MKATHYSHNRSRRNHSLSRPLCIWLAGFGAMVQATEMKFLLADQALAERKIGFQDGKGITELKGLNSVKRSRTYQVRDGETHAILVALDRERPGGKPSGVDLVVSKETASPLVLVFEDEESPAGFRAVVVDDSLKAFPWGSLRFVNGTDKVLTLQYDKESKAVPASYGFVDISPGGQARNMGVQLTPEEMPEEALYSSVWEHDPNARKLIILEGGGNGDQLTELTLAIIPQDKRAKD